MLSNTARSSVVPASRMARIAARPAGWLVARTGGDDHFHVTVESAAFDGLSLVEQHRLVNRALAAPLADGTIHELRITTKGRA